MALTKLLTDVSNIQALADQVKGQATTLKQTFDKAGNDVKTYINDTLTAEIEAIFATKTENGLKADSTSVYSKTEMDSIIGGINNAGKVEITDSYYTAIADNTANFTISGYDSASQYLELIYNNTLLIKDVEYTMSGTVVNLNGWSLANGEKIYYKITSNLISTPTSTFPSSLVSIDTSNFSGILNSSIDTVQKLADFIDDNIGGTVSGSTYYVATTGNDSNNGTYVSTPFRTIAKAVSMIPKNLDDNCYIISIANGDYTSETAAFYGLANYYGSGYIIIRGTGGHPVVPYTPINNCTCRKISFEDISFSAVGAYAMIAEDVNYLEIYSCLFNTSGTLIGLFTTNSKVSVSGTTTFSNQGTAVSATEMSTIFMKNVSGSGNNKVLEAITGSTIIKNGSMPTGTTAETVSSGGVIR